MARGRGSAIAVATALLCMLLLQSEMAHAAVYTVGDAGGWTFNIAGWPKGKRFRAGDILGLSSLIICFNLLILYIYIYIYI
jgi:hypothetical protein